MRVLFLEPYKKSPIAIQIALPFAFMTIASYVQSRSNLFSFSFYSYQLQHLIGEEMTPVSSLIAELRPDVVIVSSYSSTFYRSAELLRQAKLHGVVTVIGGIFASDNPEMILQEYPYIDIVVIGEGEHTFFQLLNQLYYDKPLAELRGIAFRESLNVFINGRQHYRVRSQDLPRVDLSLIPVEKYKTALQRHYIFASRGCQYECEFCTVNAIWNWSVTLRKMMDVLYDLRVLVDTFGMKVVSLVDSNTSTHKQYYPKLLRLLQEGVPGIKIALKGRVDEMTTEYMSDLKEAGVNHFGIGVETPLASQLRMLSKTNNPDEWATQLLRIFHYAEKIDLPINFNMIIGTPDEDEFTLQYKVDFAIKLYERFNAKPYLTFMTPHPGTASAKTLDTDGLRIIDHNWENYDHLHPVVIPISQSEGFADIMQLAYDEIAINTDSEHINPVGLISQAMPMTQRFPVLPYSINVGQYINQRQVWVVLEDVIGTNVHHEFDRKTSTFVVKNSFKVAWPFHYGFIPGLKSGDMEDLDVAVFSRYPAKTGDVRRIRIIGMALTKDGDNKVFAVFPEEMEYWHVSEYENLPHEGREGVVSIFERNGPRFTKFLDSRSAYQFILSRMNE
jgi:anaerobic magnesium-protoporphyrin IX monomethyl ester cyclase